MTVNVNSVSAGRALKTLGANIKTARLKRRISVQDFAQRIGVSASTVARLEKGDGGVSIGTLAMACLVLGEIERIADFLDAGTDDTGLLLERESLPKRIDSRRKRHSSSSAQSREAPIIAESDDQEGVGF